MTRDELISKLEQAEEGSVALDCSLYKFIHSKTIDEKPRWGGVTKFTRRLDAKLPGENIISVLKRDNGRFTASHFEEKRQQVFTTEASTEPLARRLAALKAMADE